MKYIMRINIVQSAVAYMNQNDQKITRLFGNFEHFIWYWENISRNPSNNAPQQKHPFLLNIISFTWFYFHWPNENIHSVENTFYNKK